MQSIPPHNLIHTCGQAQLQQYKHTEKFTFLYTLCLPVCLASATDRQIGTIMLWQCWHNVRWCWRWKECVGKEHTENLATVHIRFIITLNFHNKHCRKCSYSFYVLEKIVQKCCNTSESQEVLKLNIYNSITAEEDHAIPSTATKWSLQCDCFVNDSFWFVYHFD